MFSQTLYHQTTANQTKTNENKNYALLNWDKFWYETCFANNSDDSRINAMLESVKLEASIMSIHNSIMSL